MIEIGKTYQTKQGQRVKIDAVLDEPFNKTQQVIGRYLNANGIWIVTSWDIEGRYFGPNEKCPFDLVYVSITGEPS